MLLQASSTIDNVYNWRPAQVMKRDWCLSLEEKQKVKDQHRQTILEAMALSFLRFSEQQVRKDVNLVLKTIEDYITESNKPIHKGSFDTMPA